MFKYINEMSSGKIQPVVKKKKKRTALTGNIIKPAPEYAELRVDPWTRWFLGRNVSTRNEKYGRECDKGGPVRVTQIGDRVLK